MGHELEREERRVKMRISHQSAQENMVLPIQFPRERNMDAMSIDV